MAKSLARLVQEASIQIEHVKISTPIEGWACLLRNGEKTIDCFYPGFLPPNAYACLRGLLLNAQQASPGNALEKQLKEFLGPSSYAKFVALSQS